MERTSQYSAASGRTAPATAGFYPWQVLSRRRMQLLACLLLVCGVAFAATMLRKDTYEAVARVRIAPQEQTTAFMRAQGIAQPLDYFNAQTESLRSRQVLTAAAARLREHGYQWDAVDTDLRRLEEHMRLRSLTSSGLVDIVGLSPNPEEAAAIANALAWALEQTAQETRAAWAERVRASLSRQVADYEQKTKAHAMALQQFRTEHQIVGDDQALSATQRRLTSLEQRREQAEVRRISLARRRDQLQAMMTERRFAASAEMSLDEINSHASVRGLAGQIETLQQEELSLAQAYLPGHPRLRDVRLKIAELQARQQERKWQLTAALLAETSEAHDDAAREVQALDAMLVQESESGVALTLRNQEYRIMRDALERTQEFRDRCLAQLREFELAEEMQMAPVMLVDAAVKPIVPAGLAKEHQVASILLLGLLFSVTFVFVLDRLTVSATPTSSWEGQTVYIPVPTQAWGNYADVWGGRPHGDESGPTAGNASASARMPIERLPRIAVGGESEDDKAFAARCRVSQVDQRCAAAGTFRRLSAQLLSRFGRSRQALVVTGSATASGKTTCAGNLALLMANAGRRVLLVEGNLRSPSLARAWGVAPDGAGYVASLTEASSWEESVQATDVENLWVLPADADEDAAAEARDVAVLNRELLCSYDWVIYDAGTLENPFTQALLEGVGKALVISTTADAATLEQMQADVEHCGAMVVAGVDNQAMAARSHTTAHGTARARSRTG